MLLKLTTFFLALSFCINLVSGQDLPDKKVTDDPAKMQKEAMAFLRETAVDVNNLRTLENRISFFSELAGLMWFHDEKEARSMYALTFASFKELMIGYDLQMNSFGPQGAEDGQHVDQMMSEQADKSTVLRKFSMALMVRQQVATSLAEHDPELAFSFFGDSVSVLTNPSLRKQFDDSDKYFEAQLLTQIAAKDPEKAARLAEKSLSKGFSYQHLELLKALHIKNPEKGSDFASSILSEIKTAKIKPEDYWVVSSLLSTAASYEEKSKTDPSVKPMLSSQQIRELAETFGQALLDNGVDEDSSALHFAAEIQKYSKSKALQIRAKFGPKVGNQSGNVYAVADGPAEPVAPPPPKPRVNSGTNPNSTPMSAAEKTQAELKENLEKLEKELPKGEREKVVESARRILMQSGGKETKIMGLSSLAARVAKMGDKELADEIMKDASSLVSQQPKNYRDFLNSWLLISGYSLSDPDKAFPLLEDTVERVNDMISAFIKVGEFIDVSGEMINDGEVQLGAFGGQMIRSLSGEIAMAEGTVKKLASVDFNRTKNLAGRFDRSEVRILAKLIILRSLLGKQSSKEKESVESIVEKIDN